MQQNILGMPVGKGRHSPISALVGAGPRVWGVLVLSAREVCQMGRSALQCPLMGDSNPKNKQKQQAQHSAKKASNQKKPAVSAVPASGKKK